MREDDMVVNRLARFGRNTVHTVQLVEEFDRRGVHFRALDLGIDSRTPAGKVIIDVFSSFNQYERENNRKSPWRASSWPSNRTGIWAGQQGATWRNWPKWQRR
ncbi:recombinase family protein [Hymenobacter coccineus]|uniref:recombinase family protein n=1 Tax=Hymenobacter coccineus TaxID=1908235 RepID=UPI001EFA309E|nr:recombinase family protein [Hymenobacter coccineus]